MRNSALLVGLLLAVSTPAAFGQMGKTVIVQAAATLQAVDLSRRNSSRRCRFGDCRSSCWQEAPSGAVTRGGNARWPIP